MFTLPGTDQHVSIIGRTGSGKTQMGAFLLSMSDLEHRAHVVVDYKGDELLNSIENARHIDLKEKIPAKAKGLYIVHILPGQDDEVEDFLWKIWQRENTGLYIDEGYMIDKNSPAYNALLTQGRSKRINVTTLTQRPVACSRFVFSEATHFCVFRLTDIRDMKVIQGFSPIDMSIKLPEYHSQWYDVKQDRVFPLSPAPSQEKILENFDRKLEPRKRRLFL